MDTKRWMTNLKDYTKVKDLVMPGSHDAGVWASAPGTTPTRNSNIKKTSRGLKVSSIAAQLGDIKEQADNGSRWFDIRMYKTPTRWLPWEDSLRPDPVGGHKMKMRAAHVPTFQEGAIHRGVLHSPGLGGYGASIAQILSQAISFVTSNDSEFVVVRFSHCPEPKKVLKEIKYYLDDCLTADARRILAHDKHIVMPKLADMSVGMLRGKVVMIFDELFDKHSADTTFNQWTFSYSKDRSSKANVCCCGKYADSPDTQVVAHKTLKAATKHLAHGNGDGHLCFVYWQLTARLLKQLEGKGDIRKNTTDKKGTHEATGDLMEELAKLQQDAKQNPFRMPVAANVISHDFVKPDISEKIIRGNHPSMLQVPW